MYIKLLEVQMMMGLFLIVYSDAFVSLWGDDQDGDGVTDYEEMYRAINIDNDESYRVYTDEYLVSSPRQAFIGIEINF